MNNLHVKENINLDEELPKFGFVKAREYFHCGNISVRICDRVVCISCETPASRTPRSHKFALSNVLLKMMNANMLN